MTTLGQAYVQIMPSAKGISGNIQKALDPESFKAGKSAGGKIAGGITTSVAKIAGAIGITQLVAAGMNAVKSSIDGAVTRVDTLNRFPRILQQMGYGADEAHSATAKLRDGIQGIPMSLDKITGVTERMVLTLGDVGLASDSALALSNAFIASGASTLDAERGLEQYMQMLAAGEPDMQSWRTLQETMPYALSETAKAFGFTGESAQNDFYKALQSGDITFREFNEKLIELSESQGGFAEMAQSASAGIATSWGTIKTAITNGVANVIQAFDDWLASEGLGGIPEVLTGIRDKVNEVFGRIVEMVPIALEWFSNLFNTIRESTAFQSLQEVIGQVIETGQNLITTFLQSEAWATFKEILSQVAQAILDFDLASFIDKWAPLIAGIAGAVAAFQIIMGVVSTFQGIVAAATGIVSAGGAAIGFLTSPIGIAVAAIGGIIAIGVLLYKNWDTIKEKASQLGENISAAWNSLKEGTSNTWNAIKEAIGNEIESAKDTASSVVNAIKETVSNIWDSIKTTTSNVWNSIKDTISNLINSAKDIVSNVINAIRTTVSDIWNSIKTVTSNVWNGIKSIVSNLINSIKSTISSVMGSIRSTISDILNSIKTTFSNIFNGLKSTVSTAFSNVKNAVSTGMNNALSTVTGFLSKFKEAGSNIVGSIADGIRGAIGKVTDAIGSVTKKIRDFLPFSPAKEGPLKDLDKLNFGGTISLAIEDGENEVQRAMEDILSLSSLGPKVRVASGTKSDNGITQHITINSPTELSPSETARQVKNASRNLAMEW